MRISRLETLGAGMIDDAPCYDSRLGAVLVAAPASILPAEAVALAGARILLRADWADAATLLARPLRLDLLVLEAIGVCDAVLATALPPIIGEARRHGARIIVALEEDQIDTVANHAFGPHVDLLCRPSLTERVAALAVAAAGRPDAVVGEVGRDAEAARLRRLNEEVARIAETLAQLTRDGGLPPDRAPPGVGDRHNGYGAPPREDDVRASDLRQAIRARRLRGQFFDPTLLEDPAWDMLLDLYAAELERAQVSVSSLCIAAAVAPTTALRWISKMTEAGLLEREPDPFDRRRAFMALSVQARDGLRGYFAAVRRAGLSIA
ncbi:hypothetical protein ACFOKI_09670 [Sphingomonas qilianensis]|uniref:MarR family winged helix-turn-helix transcriptional regulator n=1 Tax=Sphingomonas qilianensis TaxID=1736690 RepID=A0ABU9XQ95_9SPHN